MWEKARQRSLGKRSGNSCGFELILAQAAVLGSLLAASLAGTPYQRRGNCVTVVLPGGWARVEWQSQGAFHFTRGWGRPEICGAAGNGGAVEFADHDDINAIKLQSGNLTVRVEKVTGRLSVAAGSVTLMEQSGGAHRSRQGVTIRFHRFMGERYQGLGMRDGPVFLQHGRINTKRAFLISNRGFGLYFPFPAAYEADLGEPGSSITVVKAPGAARLELYFYQGGSPREIFEEHLASCGAVMRMSARDAQIQPPTKWPAEASPLPIVGPPSWNSLRATVRAIVNASLSAMLLPAWDLASWRSAPAKLHRRAAQLAVFVPLLGDSTPTNARPEHPPLDLFSAQLRARLLPFLLTYALEAQERGYPIIHPLGMQYPRDQQGAVADDQFLFGDEILVAPALGENSRRTVYLPMGSWTDLRSNQIYPGKRTVEIEVPNHAAALLVKNGSLIPLEAEQAGAAMELHYFPALGAEFFLAEKEPWNPSQFHAAPAGDYYRLETESKQDRDYEWVVHHLDPPSKVWEAEDIYLEVSEPALLANGCWYYDRERRDLHVRQRGRAGADQVIHIAF